MFEKYWTNIIRYDTKEVRLEYLSTYPKRLNQIHLIKLTKMHIYDFIFRLAWEASLPHCIKTNQQ